MCWKVQALLSPSWKKDVPDDGSSSPPHAHDGGRVRGGAHVYVHEYARDDAHGHRSCTWQDDNPACCSESGFVKGKFCEVFKTNKLLSFTFHK